MCINYTLNISLTDPLSSPYNWWEHGDTARLSNSVSGILSIELWLWAKTVCLQSQTLNHLHIVFLLYAIVNKPLIYDLLLRPANKWASNKDIVYIIITCLRISEMSWMPSTSQASDECSFSTSPSCAGEETVPSSLPSTPVSTICAVEVPALRISEGKVIVLQKLPV